MPLVVRDRVKETTTTVGTGTLTLAGAVTGYQSFSVIGNGNTTYYSISSNGSSEWEVGIGTYTSSGTTLARNTVLASSNSNALVPFSAGTKDVYVVYPAGKSVATEFANTFTAQQTVQNSALTVSNTGTFGGSTSLTQSGTLSALSLRGGSSPTAFYNGYGNYGGYVLDSTGRNILTATPSGGNMLFYQRRFNTAFDLSSGVVDTSAANNNPFGGFTVGRTAYNENGTAIWVYQYPGRLVRYPLSTAYTLSSLGSANYATSFSLTWLSGSQFPYWFDFIDNGTKIITLDVNWSPYRYYIWNLATAYDLTSTATVSGFISQNVSNTVASFLFAENGTKFVEIVYTGSSTTQYVRTWNLPTAYSFTGATSLSLINNPNLFRQFMGYYFLTANSLFKPSYGLAQYNSANNRWVANEANAGTMFYSYLDNTFATLGDATVNDYVDGSALYNVPLTTATGTLPSTGLTGGTYTMDNLTVAGTVNFSTTGNGIAIGTSQTTGTTQIGGISQTGAITFGQSTGTQTINIGTGTVTSGNTKTINIGTNSNSGSTTTITIGSSNSCNVSIVGIPRYGQLINGTSSGTTQGTANAITLGITTYTTVPSNSGAILPASSGARIIVRNAGANTLLVYPPSGQSINSLGTNVAYSQSIGSVVEYIQVGTNAWFTF